MYDTLVDIVVRQNISFGNYALFSKSLSDLAAMQADWQAHKALVNFKPSFKEHIYPILCSIARVMRIHLRAEGELTKYHLSLDPMHYGLLGGPNSDRNARKEILCSATKFPFGDPPSQRRIAWWPAQRPDDVFRQNDPATRIDWARDENGLFKTDLDMVEKWSRLGFIVDV